MAEENPEEQRAEEIADLTAHLQGATANISELLELYRQAAADNKELVADNKELVASLNESADTINESTATINWLLELHRQTAAEKKQLTEEKKQLTTEREHADSTGGMDATHQVDNARMNAETSRNMADLDERHRFFSDHAEQREANVDDGLEHLRNA